MIECCADACRSSDCEHILSATQFWTELSLIILMVGTLISGIQQFGEAIASGINFISPDYTGVFVQGSGRLNMAIGVLCVCAPLVFINGLRQVRLLWMLLLRPIPSVSLTAGAV